MKLKTIILIILICIGPIGWVALPLYFVISKISAKTRETENARENIYNKISANPTESAIQELIEFIQVNAIINTPQSWNKVRGVWFIVNESPNISTETKYRFRDFLMTKGLRITGKDKEVIKNHK